MNKKISAVVNRPQDKLQMEAAFSVAFVPVIMIRYWTHPWLLDSYREEDEDAFKLTCVLAGVPARMRLSDSHLKAPKHTLAIM